MAVDERGRRPLFERLDEAIGPEAAETMMAHLPPVGWADVATKHDLAALEERMDLRLEVTEQRVLATLRGEMNAQTRTLVLAMIASNFTAVSLSFAAATLA